MFSTFFAFWLLRDHGLPWWLACLLGLCFAAFLGVIVQQAIIRPLLGAPTLNAVIATLGVNIALHSLAGLLWGNETNVFPSPLEGVPGYRLFGVNIAAECGDDLISVAMIVISRWCCATPAPASHCAQRARTRPLRG